MSCSGGGKGASRQGSHSRSAQPSRRVLHKPLPGPEERHKSETSQKPEGSEQLCSPRTFQNGECSHPQGLSQSRGLASESGSAGCILCNPNPPLTPPIPKVLFPGEMLSVPVPPIWTVIGSLGLYQDPEASPSSPMRDGGMTDSLHRRYP